MELTLSVPALATRVLAEVELRPAKLEKWLAALPLLNLPESGRKLFSTLSVYNRIALDDRTRLELLELLRRPIELVVSSAEKQYLGLPLPLAEKQKSAAEQNRQFHLELAFGYKRLVLNRAAQSTAPTGKALTETALAIQRAIRHLGEALAHSFKTYAPTPLEAWSEIHQLYRYAERLGVSEMAVAETLNDTIPHTSVAHAYKQALLLELSDPYHLPARLTGKVYRYLDRYAGLAVLQPAPAAYENSTCQFLIDLAADRAAVPYVDGRLEQPERFRLLNTLELVRNVHAQLTALQNGQVPPADGLEADFFRDSGQDLLRHLGLAWGINPGRVFPRRQGRGEELELAVGLEAANYWLNGGAKFVVSSTFVGPLPQRTQLGTNPAQPPHIEMPSLAYSAWQIEDESAGGLALVKKGYIKERLRVGELVAYRLPGAGHAWSIGAVRWVKSESPSHLALGIERLAPRAEPVVVKTVSDEGKESDFLPAVLLPALPPLKQPETLITHRGVWRRHRLIYLDNGARLMRVRLGDPVEFTSAFERFGFEIEEA
jgi:hypothetical protein